MLPGRAGTRREDTELITLCAVVEIAPGAVPSPNIWNSPQVYEIENWAVDPAGVTEPAMRRPRPWDGATALDLGWGAGFRLPLFASTAGRVVGIEPHAGL